MDALSAGSEESSNQFMERVKFEQSGPAARAATMAKQQARLEEAARYVEYVRSKQREKGKQ